MRQTSGKRRSHGEKVVKDIRRATRRQYSAEEKIREKIRIVLDGLKGEDNEPCRAIGPSDNGECGTVSAQRDRSGPKQPLVQGVSGSWEAAIGGRHRTSRINEQG